MATITYSPYVHYTAEYRATAAATFYKVTATGSEPRRGERTKPGVSTPGMPALDDKTYRHPAAGRRGGP
mgnify:CR=1 FL=1